MRISKLCCKRLRAITAITGGISFLCSLLHLIQQDGTKSNSGYYLEISSIDAFMIFAVTFLVVTFVLFIIAHTSDARIEQNTNAEIHYAQYTGNNRLILVLVLIFLSLFIISQGLNIKNDIEMNAFSLGVVVLALAIDIFIARNIILYLQHRELIKAREEKARLHIWVQISFFLASQILWLFISSVFDIIFIEKLMYVIVSLFFIGMLSFIICLATLRARGSKIRVRRMTRMDVASFRRASYVFLILIATVFALACIVI